MFYCISCQRLLFRNSVQDFFEGNFPPEVLSETIDRRNMDGKKYICYTCKNYLSKKKIPPMCHKNNLQLFDISQYEELHLTELENAMIALNIIFQKVIKLPKSRWPATKDRIVNIPVFAEDVIESVKRSPRTPYSAGIIPVKFKRKLNYKNSHMIQYVSIDKVKKALKTLKKFRS